MVYSFSIRCVLEYRQHGHLQMKLAKLHMLYQGNLVKYTKFTRPYGNIEKTVDFIALKCYNTNVRQVSIN